MITSKRNRHAQGLNFEFAINALFIHMRQSKPTSDGWKILILQAFGSQGVVSKSFKKYKEPGLRTSNQTPYETNPIA